MTPITSTGKPLSIGQLSRLTGVPVRTIRYYSDEGILEVRRGPGGHRVFDTTAVESLLLVRRLRALGVSLQAITDVLSSRRSIGEAVSAERAAVDTELAALSWRRASLSAVEHAAPHDRAVRLQLLSNVQDGRSAHNFLVEFWRRLFAGSISPDAFDGFIDMSLPAPPGEPTPERVLAYAELVVLARQPALSAVMAQQLWRFEPTRIADRRDLVAGVAEACEMALPAVLADRAPSPGRAVDRFVEAHAHARRVKDTPKFRRALAANGGADHDARIHRYWSLAGEIAGETPTVGNLQHWLYAGLLSEVGA